MLLEELKLVHTDKSFIYTLVHIGGVDMISIKVKGSTKRTEAFLRKSKKLNFSNLDQYGVMGVNALASATPMDTGVTASSWDYKIIKEDGKVRIVWTNSNVVKGQQIALLLQYGHATGNGGYVVGRDYINPALQPIFDDMANNAWKEVTNNG